MDKNLENRIAKLENELKEFKQKYATHQHTITDGTSYLRKNIILDADQSITVGDGQWQTFRANNSTDGLNYISGTTIGPNITPGASQKSPNMQMLMTHIPTQASKFSFLTAECAPLVLSYANTSISTTATGNTVTISGYNFITNELTGAYINIFNSSGTLIETQKIASNTATVVTISGTWRSSTTGTFKIYNPVFLGRTETIFHRVYVEEGTTAGGVRFGVGPTNGGQNGLIYMDSSGNLFWRDKAGTSTQLNGGGGGGAPGGNDRDIQFNDSGSFGGTDNFKITTGGRIQFDFGAGDDGLQVMNDSTLYLTGGGGPLSGDSTIQIYYDIFFDSLGDKILGESIATNATRGFLFIPNCAGTPTGHPTEYSSGGDIPFVFDRTNSKLYVYNGSWKSVTLT